VIQLDKGDKPSQVVIGQPGMWQMTQAMAGDTPLLALMPRFKDLHTNLMIAATSADGNARIYYVNLVSDESNYIPKVGFYYPGDIKQAWTVEADKAHAEAKVVADAKAKADNETIAAMPSLSASNLHFNWTMSCGVHTAWFGGENSCDSIKPTRVFDDGKHTYLAMPASLADTTGLPTIMANNTAGKPALINYRFKEGYYIVDGVPAQINLIAGNGDGSNQKVVEITHQGE
jgi:type IV secretion system protein VirB9